MDRMYNTYPLYILQILNKIKIQSKLGNVYVLHKKNSVVLSKIFWIFRELQSHHIIMA